MGNSRSTHAAVRWGCGNLARPLNAWHPPIGGSTKICWVYRRGIGSPVPDGPGHPLFSRRAIRRRAPLHSAGLALGGCDAPSRRFGG